MNATFYSGFKKRKNSTKQPSGGVTKSVVLKDQTSLMHPAFVISTVDWSWNYASAWGNYYYITDIVAETNGTFRIECHLDPLATYKTDIGNYEAYIERANDISYRNEYITDSLYPSINAPTVTRTLLGGGYSSYYFVVGFTGTDVSGLAFYRGSVAYYITNQAGVQVMLDNMVTRNTLLENSTPMDYLVSCVIIPDFPVGAYGTAEVHLGGNYVITFGAYSWGSSPVVYSSAYFGATSIPAHPQASTRGNYLKCSPFTRVTLFAGPFGTLSLDPNVLGFVGGNVSVSGTQRIDPITGKGVLFVNGTDGTPKYIMNGQVGVPVQLAKSFVGSLSSLVATAGSAGAMGLAVASENYVGAGMALISTVGNVAQGMSPRIQTNGTNGSFADYYAPFMVTECFEVVDDFPDQFGYPVCENHLIRMFAGYVKCSNASIDVAGHEAEMIEINANLNSGFYYE